MKAVDQLEALENFAVFAEAESLRAAARTLGMVPSTLLRRMRALEKDFGRRLFAASPRGIALTPEGMALHAKVARILAGMNAEAPGDAAGFSGAVPSALPPIPSFRSARSFRPSARSAKRGIFGLKSSVPGASAGPTFSSKSSEGIRFQGAAGNLPSFLCPAASSLHRPPLSNGAASPLRPNISSASTSCGLTGTKPRLNKWDPQARKRSFCGSFRPRHFFFPMQEPCWRAP